MDGEKESHLYFHLSSVKIVHLLPVCVSAANHVVILDPVALSHVESADHFKSSYNCGRNLEISFMLNLTSK